MDIIILGYRDNNFRLWRQRGKLC